jgi:hypothetical protein
MAQRAELMPSNIYVVFKKFGHFYELTFIFICHLTIYELRWKNVTIYNPTEKIVLLLLISLSMIE